MAERGRDRERRLPRDSARGRAAALWGRAAVAASAGREVGAGRRARPTPGGSDPSAPPRGHLRQGLVAAAAIALTALLLHTRGLQVSRLEISGLRQMTPAEVEADLGLPPGAYVWQVRPWVVERRLLQDPLVARARSAWLWPNGLRVTITERLPVALVLDGQTAWEVDASGRLLRALPNPDGLPPQTLPGLGIAVPTISGLRLPEARAGAVVSSPALDRALEVAESLGGAWGTQITAVTVTPDGRVGVTAAGGVPVDYGDGSAAGQKTSTLLGILALARTQGVRLASCDLSAPATPACRTEPGSRPLVSGPAQGPG